MCLKEVGVLFLFFSLDSLWCFTSSLAEKWGNYLTQIFFMLLLIGTAVLQIHLSGNCIITSRRKKWNAYNILERNVLGPIMKILSLNTNYLPESGTYP